MATCPKCLGHLTENHVCHGVFRRVLGAVWIVGAGAIVGSLLTWMIWERPTPALVVAAAALGGVLASAVRNAIGRGF